MKLDALEIEVVDSLSSALMPLGFKMRSPGQYVRASKDIEHVISLGPVKTSRGLRLTGGGMGVRVPKIEEIRSASSGGFASTAGIPIHLLKPEKSFREWEIDCRDEVDSIVSTIARDIVEYGLPYFDGLLDSKDFCSKIRSEQWMKSFACTPDRRNALIVYLTWIGAGAPAGLEAGHQILADLGSKPEKYTVELRLAIERARAASLG